MQAIKQMQTQRMEHMPYQEADSDWKALGAGFSRLEPCQADVVSDLGWEPLDLTLPGLDIRQLVRDCG